MPCPTCATPTAHGHCTGCYRLAAQWRGHFMRYARHDADCRAFLLSVLGEEDAPGCTCGVVVKLLLVANGEQRAELPAAARV